MPYKPKKPCAYSRCPKCYARLEEILKKGEKCPYCLENEKIKKYSLEQ